MTKEYIEREPLLKSIRAEGVSLLEQEGRRTNEVLAYGHCFGMVDSAPAADVVEVVRCKDCEHGREIDRTKAPEKYYRSDCVVCQCEDVVGDEPMVYKPSHFCSCGERKDNEQAP